ncbi:hypothetical protein Slu03_23420 [Sediminihabitans luteus]|nr:hypothetical protein Slu03_23420 [Sediminihabitans luteus]
MPIPSIDIGRRASTAAAENRAAPGVRRTTAYGLGRRDRPVFCTTVQVSPTCYRSVTSDDAWRGMISGSLRLDQV